MIHPRSQSQIRPIVVIAAIAIAAMVVLRIVVGGGISAQQLGWPTPPPGPAFDIPSEQQLAQTVQSDVALAGSQVEVIPPSWPGPLPLVPPVSGTRALFDLGGPQLEAFVDAGTFRELVQLRMTPVDAPLALADANVLIAFRLEAFDAVGNEISAPLQRPITITVRLGPFIESATSGNLLFALVDDDDRSRLHATSLNLGPDRS